MTRQFNKVAHSSPYCFLVNYDRSVIVYYSSPYSNVFHEASASPIERSTHANAHVLYVQIYVQAVVTDWTVTDPWRHDDSVNNRCSLQ